MSNQEEFIIKGIYSKDDQALIEAEIEVLKGVKNISINPKTGKCRVEFDSSEISQKKIIKTIESMGYSVEAQINKPSDEASNTKSSNNKKIIIAGTIIGLLVIVYLIYNTTTDTDKTSANNSGDTVTNDTSIDDDFQGEKGTSVKAQNNQVLIDESSVNDGNIHAFNYYSVREGKNIYFFIVQASDGTYRAAANACEVCFAAKTGFNQVGDSIRCENCQNTYEKDVIALEKGGCNPGPIDKNVQVTNGQLVINTADIEAVAYLF